MGMTQGFTGCKGVAMQGQGANEVLFSKSFRPAMNAVWTNFLYPFVFSGQKSVANVKPVTVKVEKMVPPQAQQSLEVPEQDAMMD